MKVQDTNLTGTSAAAAPPSGAITRQPGLGDAACARPGNGDRVDLSGFTGKLGTALTAQSQERAARVAALARDYQAGRYAPDAQKTSRALEPATDLATRAGAHELEACREPLASAAGLLQAALASLGPAPAHAGVRSALDRFRRELRTCDALNQHAMSFYANWMRLLTGLSGQAYSPPGGPALPSLVPCGRRVSLEA